MERAVAVEPHSTHAAHNFTEDYKIEIAVFIDKSRRMERLFGDNRFEDCRDAVRVRAKLRFDVQS